MDCIRISIKLLLIKLICKLKLAALEVVLRSFSKSIFEFFFHSANRPNTMLLAHFSCVVSGLSKEKVVTFDLGTSDVDQDPGGKCTMFLV